LKNPPRSRKEEQNQNSFPLFLRGGLVGLLLLPTHEKPAVQVRQTKKREQQYITDGHDVQVLASASSSFRLLDNAVVVVVVFVVVVVVHLAQEKQILPSPNCSVHFVCVYANVRILEDVVSRGPDAEKNIREFVEADVQSKRVFVRDFSSLLEEIFLCERRRGRSEIEKSKGNETDEETVRGARTNSRPTDVGGRF
tara:strand:- start:3993 stop:4580 length:588 start_codon:yes stop_codon:yes gene_type:complete